MADQGHPKQVGQQSVGEGGQGSAGGSASVQAPTTQQTNQPAALQATMLENEATVQIQDPGLAAAAIVGGVTIRAFQVASKVPHSPAVAVGTGIAAGAMSLAAFCLANRPKADKAICKVVEIDGHIEMEKIEEGSLLVHVNFLSQAGYWVLRALNEKLHQGTDHTCLQLLLEDELRKIGWTGPIQVELEGWWFASEGIQEEGEAAGTEQLPPPDAEREAQGELQPRQAGEYLLRQGGQAAPQAAGQADQGPQQMQQHLQQAALVRFHPEQQGYRAQAARFPHQGFPMPPQPAGQVYHNVPPASQAAANVGQPPALQMSVGAFGGATIRINPALVVGGLVFGATIGGFFAASRISASPEVVLRTGLAAGMATGVTTMAAFYLSNRQQTDEADEREQHIQVESIEEG